MGKLYGNAIVGQSGGPSAAINATLAGVISAALQEDCRDKNGWMSGAIDRIYGMRNGIDGLLRRDILELNDLFSDPDRLTLLSQTPAAALGSCRRKLPSPEEDAELYRQIFEILEAYNIRFFFYIGGNDSMDTVDKLSRYAATQNYRLRVMGVPKTIDNDLFGTDHTPGFGSAAKYIATTVSEIIRDCAVYTIPAVTLVEVMGRGTGWLAASAALPRLISEEAPDYVYLPERVFDYTRFLSDVKAALARHPNVVIVVSEGLKTADGKFVSESTDGSMIDVFGHRYLSGTAQTLKSFIREKIGCKVRSVELNLPQRCAGHMVARCDIEESFDAGRSAVVNACSGQSGKMITIIRTTDTPYESRNGVIDVAQVANAIKLLPDDFTVPEGNNVTDACLRHLLPLIAGECAVRYENGIPKHLIL